MRYRTIVADPPWAYEGFASSPTPKRGLAQQVKVDPLPYPSMSVADLCDLGVREVCSSDARLFLWTTNRYLRDAFDVMGAWGFEYRQAIVWRKSGNPSPFGGSVAPNHAEFLLVGRRGAPPVATRWKSSVITAPAAAAPGSHSAKPECFIDLIEQVSPGPYLELFARRARFGWDYAGDGSLGTVDIPGLRAPGQERDAA